MQYLKSRFSPSIFAASPAYITGLILGGALALTLSLTAWAAQDSATQQAQPAAGGQPPAQPNATPQAPAPPPAEAPPPPARASVARPVATHDAPAAEITEDQVRKLLVGKQLFLRGGYLDNTLSFNEHGELIGHSPQGSYTLSAIEIDKVHLTKHKVELEGQRYGLHFLGALPYEDPTKAVDRVNITPKKKEVKITIDRELVVKSKQPKDKNKSAKNAPKSAPGQVRKSSVSAPARQPGWIDAISAADTAPLASQTSSSTEPGSTPATAQAPNPTTTSVADQPNSQAEPSDAAEAQAEMAAVPPAERPADSRSVTTTTSVAHANKVLLDAIGNVFAQGFDARMMDSMPGFWKLYYQAVAAKSDYRPADPSVLRQNMVDQKAKLISSFEPASNQYAQDSGVAGMSLYHVVVGADGKPGEISVARPIGFGLDESAVDSIRKATFSPAIKDGRPVPVLLDLVVEFRIYSKRTNVASAPETASRPHTQSLPGPYSVQNQ